MAKVGRAAKIASRQRIETLGNGTNTPTDKTLTKIETGELYFIDHNHASALTVTLPPARSGSYFKFIFKTNLTADGSVVIKTSEGTAGSMIGSIFEQVTGGSNAASAVQQDNDSDFKITLSDDIHQGSWVECFCDGSVWHVNGKLNVSGVGESGFGVYSSPNPAMTKLVAGFDQGYASFASTTELALSDIDDRTDKWDDNTYRMSSPTTAKRLLWMAYGKDGSGNPHYVTVSDKDTDSLYQISSTDYADKEDWTAVNATGTGGDIKQHKALWGNDVWISIGNISSNKVVLRSTNGTSWSAVDISTPLDDETGGKSAFSASKMAGLTTDGSGTWWIAGGSQIYKSTDGGATWAFEVDLGSSHDVAGIRHLVYTNNTVAALIKHSSGGTDSIRIVTAAASDTTDWGTSVAADDGTGGSGKMHITLTKLAAAGNGRVIFIDTGNCMSFDVDGKTATRESNRIEITDGSGPGDGNVNCIATDGEGNWWIGCDGSGSGSSGGDICYSTDNGDTWSLHVSPIDRFRDHRVESLAVDRYLPL